jgi:23S rRNA (guanosine2251-2'-O)-methyltransferase
LRNTRHNNFKGDSKTKSQQTGRRPGGVQLFGFHAVTEAWLNPQRQCMRLLLTQSALRQFEGQIAKSKKAGLKRPAPEIVDGKAIDKLLPQGTVHQGILLEAENLPDRELDDMLAWERLPSAIVVLDQVTDPHNVGAILRSACAFGIGAVLVTERNAASQTGVLAKTASGALEHTPIIRTGNMSQSLKKLQSAGYWCIGLDETGKNALHHIKMPAKVALVLGAEGEGLRRLTIESCDEIAKLPTLPPVGSLNVSNAAAVAIYEVMRGKNELKHGLSRWITTTG